MHLNPWLLPPPSSIPLLGGLNLHPPGPTSGWTPMGCSPAQDWAPQCEPAQCQGASEGSWVPKHKPPFMSQLPHAQKHGTMTWKGDALTHPSFQKKPSTPYRG